MCTLPIIIIDTRNLVKLIYIKLLKNALKTLHYHILYTEQNKNKVKISSQ